MRCTQEYSPAQTLYNRWKRWGWAAERHRFDCGRECGAFARIMVGLAVEGAEHNTIMIDATYVKAHGTGQKRGRGRQIG